MGNVISGLGVGSSWVSSSYAAFNPDAIKPKPLMSSLLDFFRDLSATTESKLLKKHDIENPIGTPTNLGLSLSAEISYKANREAIIVIAKQLEEEEKKGKE